MRQAHLFVLPLAGHVVQIRTLCIRGLHLQHGRAVGAIRRLGVGLQLQL